MVISRREALPLAGAATLAAGCAPLAQNLRPEVATSELRPPKGSNNDAKRTFDRIGFGPRPGDLQRYATDGREAVIEQELKANAAEDLSLNLQLARLDVYRMDSMEAFDLPDRVILGQLQQAALLRSIYGRNQLQERMVDLWSNHFNLYGKKGFGAWRIGKDQVDVVRKHALGKFPDMLLASAKSPAMLAYLDNRLNERAGPNENYAREIMELHSMGVNGGYTQKDILEVARCFTGWTIETRYMRPRGKFRFDPEVHDDGEKVVLGHRIAAGGGEKDAHQVVQILSDHPSTAKFIAGKLTRAFLGDAGEEIEPKVEDAYRRTNGDIREMLRPILLSNELIEGPALIKRPLDLIASSIRALDAETDGGSALQEHLTCMGQPLYQWPMPDGYPDDTKSWTGSMLPRWNFALALGENSIGGTQVRKLEPALAFAALHGREPKTHELDGGLAMALAHPDFQWK